MCARLYTRTVIKDAYRSRKKYQKLCLVILHQFNDTNTRGVICVISVRDIKKVTLEDDDAGSSHVLVAGVAPDAV